MHHTSIVAFRERTVLHRCLQLRLCICVLLHLCICVQLAKQAYELPDDDIWHQLGTEALRQGNHQVSSATYSVFQCIQRCHLL